MSVPLLRWAAPGPYEVAFSTRLGGVSEGPYDSLNLGLLTDDESERVLENRRRLCEAVDAAGERASMPWQVHGGEVLRADARGIATPRADNPRCDGLWTDTPGEAVLTLAADCLPIALARADEARPPAVAVLHAGWRGLLAGVVAAGAHSLGSGTLAAIVGPSIGPCCYEVGEEVAGAYREAFGDDVVSGRNLDLWTAAERALRAAGVDQVERLDECTACRPELYFSHRRDAGSTGRQGVIALVRG